MELHDPRGDEFAKISSGAVLRELEKLKPEERTVDVVTQIIGNSSWVTLSCHGCYDPQEKVASLGAGFFKKFYCQRCLHKALELF